MTVTLGFGEWGASAQFDHPHGVVVGEDRQEEEHLELVEAQAVLALECAIEGPCDGVAGVDKSQERVGSCRFEVPRTVGPIDDARHRGREFTLGVRRVVHGSPP